MTSDRFQELTAKYSRLRIAIVGDFCLDRYLEIAPEKAETSLETGLQVHNVVKVRAQPGAAGTVLNNLVALGVGEIFPVGFCGEDGEGYELRRALSAMKPVKLDHFVETPLRRTFTYCKPLVIEPNAPPRELNRLDSKNWTPTPEPVVKSILQSLAALSSLVDAVIAMDQVDTPETGVMTSQVLPALTKFSPSLPVIADSRRGLSEYPAVSFKMNAAELNVLMKLERAHLSVDEVKIAAGNLAKRNGRPAFITMAERGIVGAAPNGTVEHVPSLPLRGPIDIVGAGDSVTANLAAALAAGATVGEAIELAALASSIVIHQLGTTGTASVAQIAKLREL